MRLHPRIVSSAAVIAITCAVTAAALFYKTRNTELNEVMVFCKLQFNAYNCFDKLISYVEAAKHSVHICMPGIQNPAIQGRLVNLLKTKKIKIRILIDGSGYDESTDFLIKELIQAGAEVRRYVNKPYYKMQHKFCLVDEKILMTGTLNWGNDRSADHWNYVYITSKSKLVEPVNREFCQMWNVHSSDIGQKKHKKKISTDINVETVEDISDKTTVDSDSLMQTVLVDPQPIRETLSTPEVYIM